MTMESIHKKDGLNRKAKVQLYIRVHFIYLGVLVLSVVCVKRHEHFPCFVYTLHILNVFPQFDSLCQVRVPKV